VSKLVGKRVSLLFVGLLFVVLSSCAQSASPDTASRENAGEETISLVEDAASEITGSSTSTSIASSAPEPTQSTQTNPAVGASGMVSSANPLATRAGLEILLEGGTPSTPPLPSRRP
jgi:hypothetical protein